MGLRPVISPAFQARRQLAGPGPMFVKNHESSFKGSGLPPARGRSWKFEFKGHDGVRYWYSLIRIKPYGMIRKVLLSFKSRSPMSKTKVSVLLRTALWRTKNCRCFYCNEPVNFIDLQIDHIIPETTDLEYLQELIVKLELPREFTLNSPQNLVPTHHGCNSKKSNQKFSEGSLRYYLEIWSPRQGDIERHLQQLQDQSKNEKLLTALASRIEGGFLSSHEVTRFLESIVPSLDKNTSEPLVLCFGVNIEDLYSASDLPDDAPRDYVHLCDWLEQDLISRVREAIPSLSVRSGASERNGETLTVCITFWNLDINVLEQIDLSPWEVLQVASYSEIYDGSWDELFPRAVVQTYHDVIRDKNSRFSRFHLARCPECASSQLEERTLIDYAHDEDHYVIQCQECGWSDWSQ